jgi:excisionase family DNA binding protein
MASPPRTTRPDSASSSHRLGLLFQHVRAAIDILEQIAREEQVEAHVSEAPHGGMSTAKIISGASEKRCFTIKEVISMLGVGRSTIYAAIAHNRLKAVKLGSRTLILGDDLQRWIATFPFR